LKSSRYDPAVLGRRRWRDRAERDKARELLVPIKFTEGSRTRDLWEGEVAGR